MTELQKYLKTLDDRIALIELSRLTAQIDAEGWRVICNQLRVKLSENKDEKQLLSLERLQGIARDKEFEAKTQMNSYNGKTEELSELRKRILQAISMIEIENNVRSVTAMHEGSRGLEHQAHTLELETREIRRLLYATDGLMEITS